ncbi:hypothetical protein [Sulfurospirillum sp. MES]|uniref:hypothetical protein n=1 Tax=Sulfurospirillum sp. MES TaxID=1565314 RepID=UPI00054442B8|nr:hypothetical protein [Sulfurospirillum sp. MES]KHG33014.1 MAG: hypothetical protein OA34_12125 [Sulfurospirillum sp. MES]
MNIKRIFGVTVLMALSLCATEVKVDGSYSKLLGNPFKAKLETKTQDISIVQGESKLIPLNVETNRNDFSFRKPELSVLNTACNNVLKSFVAEDYNVVSNASKKVSCEILPSTVVKIDYVMKEDHSFANQISDIVVHLVIRVNDNGKTYEDTIDMNKDLNLKGAMQYELSIRSEMNIESLDLEENVKKIFENAIYSILAKNKKG